MIRKVVIRGFKRFEEVTFDMTGHVVLAGPNNTGKTTLLQAISAWSLAFEHWKKLNNFSQHNGAYTKAPITRQSFSAVPLRKFDHLWRDRIYKARNPIEIEVHVEEFASSRKWALAMEFIPQSTEQIYVRPKAIFSFSIDIGYVAQLNTGIIDASIRDVFNNQSKPLMAAATLTVKQTDSKWVVESADTRYHIRNEEQAINVYEGILLPDELRQLSLDAVFVPAMTGLTTDEPVYQPEKIRQLLGMARPGEVLRNLLVESLHSDDAWSNLCDAIKRLFDYTLLPPDTSGADIIAEYSMKPDGPHFDIASAGSGFQQVLMLLTFLNTRPASVLLIDEPDAHLHILLQNAIYNELRANAVRQHSQLIIATHSEVVINSVDTNELYVMLNRPRPLAIDEDRKKLLNSLKGLENVDIMMAEQAKGILYLEDQTDLNNLIAWARVLDHPIAGFLATEVFWKKTVVDPSGMNYKDHYETLKLVRQDLPGLVIVDRDAKAQLPDTEIKGEGLQVTRWRRYEIESYLVHPIALARFVKGMTGSGSDLYVADLMKHFEENYPPAFIKDPLQDITYLLNTKARTDLIPPALNAAGFPNISHSQYNEIAALMLPEEIHPEVLEKLDAIQRAFNL